MLGWRIAHRLARLVRGGPALPELADIEAHFAATSAEMPLSHCLFCVMDTELTGLDRRTDEIVSIGAVRVRGLGIGVEDCFHTCVRHERLSKTSILIHRLTPEELDAAPRLPEALARLIGFLGRSVIVGHNVGLDMGFLDQACRERFGSPLPNPRVDTVALAQAFELERPADYYERFREDADFSLAGLAERYNLPGFPEHHALYDALQTAYLFLFLVKKLRGGRLATLKDLLRAARGKRL